MDLSAAGSRLNVYRDPYSLDDSNPCRKHPHFLDVSNPCRKRQHALQDITNVAAIGPSTTTPRRHVGRPLGVKNKSKQVDVTHSLCNFPT